MNSVIHYVCVPLLQFSGEFHLYINARIDFLNHIFVYVNWYWFVLKFYRKTVFCDFRWTLLSVIVVPVSKNLLKEKINWSEKKLLGQG